MSTQPESGRVPQWTMADRLRKAREGKPLSQQELADLIGISRRSVSAYEGGDTPPRRPVLLSWALATNVSLVWLQSGESPPGPKGPEGLGVGLPRLDSNQKPAGNRVVALLAAA